MTIYKTLTILFLSAFLSQAVQAQQATIRILTPPIVLAPNQLGQVQVTNLGQPKNMFIKLALATTEGRVYAAEYHNIRIASGTQLLHLGQMVPDSREFSDLPQARILRQTGRFAPGIYSLCADISESPIEPSDNCVRIEARPTTPPILIQPSNRATITTTQPLLTWLAPGLWQEGVSYSLRMTFIDSGQTPLDALQRNPITFSEDNLRHNTLSYPPTATPLQPGKSYAWQVEAFVDEYSFGITEVWEFTIKGADKKEQSTNTSYFKARTYNDGTFCTADPTLNILIPNIKTSQRARLIFTDMEGKIIKPYKRVSSILNLSPGDNFLNLDLDEMASFESDKYYSMNISTSNGQYHVTFLYSAKSNN